MAPAEEDDDGSSPPSQQNSAVVREETEERRCIAQARRLLRQQAPVAEVLAALQGMGPRWGDFETQERIHKALLQDPLDDAFPPAADYRARFVRQLSAALEEGEGVEEVIEPILRELNALLLGGGGGPGSIGDGDSACYVTFECPVVAAAAGGTSLGNEKQEGEEEEGMRHPPPSVCTLACRVAPRENQVGLKLWEACYVLADFLLLARPALCRGRHVVELGAGVGLLGLIASYCLGAARVTLTDVDPEVLRFLRHNVEANASFHASGAGGGNKQVEVAALDWSERGDYEALLGGGEGERRLVLAADCIYDRAAIPSFVQVLIYALASSSGDDDDDDDAMASGTVVLVASTLRNPETYACFEEQVAAQGLVMEDALEGSRKDGDGESRSPFFCPNRGAVRLCRIRRRRREGGLGKEEAIAK